MDGWMDDKSMDGWINGWMDGWIYTYTDIYIYKYVYVYVYILYVYTYIYIYILYIYIYIYIYIHLDMFGHVVNKVNKYVICYVKAYGLSNFLNQWLIPRLFRISRISTEYGEILPTSP